LTVTVNEVYGLNVPHEAPPTPRQRRHAANLDRIVEAAGALAAEGGLEALSMAKLADAVDFTAGALYRYFPSKDAVLAALVGRHLAEALGFLSRAEAALPKGAGALTRVAALVQGYRAFARERPQAFGLVAVTLAEPKVLLADAKDAGPVAERALQALEPLAAALGGAVTEAQLAPGEALPRTLVLFGLLQGLLPMQKLARFAPGRRGATPVLDALVDDGVRALLLGWGATPRAVDAALRRAATLTLEMTP
jgi:AcrR family transcriptional regulator